MTLITATSQERDLISSRWAAVGLRRIWIQTAKRTTPPSSSAMAMDEEKKYSDGVQSSTTDIKDVIYDPSQESKWTRLSVVIPPAGTVARSLQLAQSLGLTLSFMDATEG